MTTATKILAGVSAAEIRADMADALESEEIPWWDECWCACDGGIVGYGELHRRYTGSCVGHDADECPGGKYYPHSDWEVGGWEHGPLCMVLYRRRPDLDDLAGAAWEDTADGSIMRRDPMLDPNTMEIKIRRPKCSG